MTNIYGYVRISTKDQNEDRQIISMHEYGVPDVNIYADEQSGKNLVGTFLSDVVLQLLSFVAENERSNIRQRQAEGIAAAKSKGVRFGRPPDPLPSDFDKIYRRWEAGEMTRNQAAKALAIPASTFRYKAKRYAESENHR